jgi:hypothetical protein
MHPLKVADYESVNFGPQKRGSDQLTQPDHFRQTARFCLNLTTPQKQMIA